MNRQTFPILEYDSNPDPILKPGHYVQAADVPEHCVLTFFQDVIDALLEENKLKVLARPFSEIGSHPLYEMDVQGQRLAVFHPGVGAPLAAFLVEEIITLGCGKFIACGGAGTLDPQTPLGHIIVPTSAVRDEGTSYHYLPPAREVEPDSGAVDAIEQTLKSKSKDYSLSKTWTTDAIYRETPGKIALRRSEGCVAVEMETAALFAVARYRDVPLGQLLYAGDMVGGDTWDSRDWEKQHAIRNELFWLAAEACLSL